MTAAEVAAVHADYVSNFVRHCTCGQWSDTSPTANYSRLNFVGHVLDALKAAGYAVVELPDPMAHRDGVAEKLHPHPMWQAGDSWTCLLDAETIEFESDAQSAYGTVDPACARTLAAALLAAADAAEQTTPDPHAGQLWANELQSRQRQVPSDREWS